MKDKQLFSHVRRGVSEGLRLRGVDVLTAQEDGAAEMDDPELLDRAMNLGRVVFTQDEDFLREAQRRQETGQSFAGVVYAHQLNVTIDHSSFIVSAGVTKTWARMV